ncbi:DNA-binding protein [Komagataeibacter intermedius AF2]|uniref:DNA-binding protein n=1 Tax=Komagataeibacter intermedius AF2 TaxID=1458464 RepID=A0A0N1F6L4_9PROT|nr:helix-turn-helix transcriptional regulator [Komagataeibacter intermedius]KPH85017.1 DNA-binding protein [Komagataeibacter intermedius AF2]
MTLPSEQYRALGAFLRARRDALSPQDVGLHVLPGRRRARGLRREEAAQLCGISTTWYTWLEQGRNVSCSAATLARIATALHLSPAERLYLFELARLKDPDALRPVIASSLPEPVRTFPEHVTVPCYVLDPLWNACVANEAAQRLFVGWLDSEERNLLCYVFLDPAARTFLDDWEGSARRVLAEFRAASIRGDKQQVEALVQTLGSRSPDFERLWHNQSVLLREGGPRRFYHPVEGPLDFDQTTLTFTIWPHYHLVTLRPR